MGRDVRLVRRPAPIGPDPDGANGQNTFWGEVNLTRAIDEIAYKSDGSVDRATERQEGTTGKFKTVDEYNFAFAAVTVSKDFDGKSTAIIADIAGRPLAQLDKRGNYTVMLYDRVDRPTMIRDASGSIMTIQYFDKKSSESNGQTVWAFNNPPSEIYVDDRAVRIEKITDGRNLVTWNQYDADGNLIRSVHPDPDGAATRLQSTSDVYRYNADGTLAAEWQEYGLAHEHHSEKTYVYDTSGRLKKVYDDDGMLQEYQYDALDNVTVQTASNGTSTHNTYDELGRLVSQTESVNSLAFSGVIATSQDYDAFGRVIHSVNQYGDETYTRYDIAGRVVTQFGAPRTYSDNGDSISQYLYDNDGRLIASRTPDGTQTIYSNFDGAGRAQLETVRLSASANDFTNYVFDANGNVERLADAASTVTDYVYDGLNRMTFQRLGESLNQTDLPQPGVMERSYHYDANGNLDEFVDRNGVKTVYEYDGLDRRIKQQSYDASGEQIYEAGWEFDQAGNLTYEYDRSIENGAYVSGSSFTYSAFDERGRAWRVNQVYRIGDQSVSTQYDYTFTDYSDSNLPGIATGWGVLVTIDGSLIYSATHTFDGLGREIRARFHRAGTSALEVTYEYLLTPQTSSVGNAQDYVRSTVERRYDLVINLGTALGPRLLSTTTTTSEMEDSELVDTVVHKASDDQVMASYGYEYNSRGQVQNQTWMSKRDAGLAASSQSFVYDDAGQVVNPQAGTIPITYTGGRRSDLLYTNYSRVRQADTYRLDGSLMRRTYAYDNEGNRTLQVMNLEGTSDSARWYEYDHANRITSVVDTNAVLKPNGEIDSETPVSTTKLYYDVRGKLMGELWDNHTAALIDDTLEFYLYDASGGRTAILTATRNPDSTGTTFPSPTTTTIYSTNANGVLTAVYDNKTGATYWPLADGTGTVHDYATFKFTTGKFGIPKYFKYDVYGNPAISGDHVIQPIYKGQIYDHLIDLYATPSGSWYDPVIGENLRLNGWADQAGQRREKNRPTANQNFDFNFGEAVIDSVQESISVLGMIPVVGIGFDLGNAAVYAYRGKHADAALSAIGAIPGVGDVMAAGKLATKATVTVAERVAKTAIGMVENAAKNALGQVAAGAIDGRDFSMGQLVGATIGGMAPGAAAGLGAAVKASQKGMATRLVALGVGSAATNAASSAAAQYIDNGSVNIWEVLKQASLSGFGAALNQHYYDRTCFVAGTPLLWEHGHKPIETFRKGEQVYARNELDPNGPLELKRIEEIFVRRGLVTELTVGGRTIGTTAEHPFYVQGRGWTPAGEIEVGELIADAAGGWLPVEARYNTGRIETVYNFRVAEHHTYFVQGDDWGFGVWAHNANQKYGGHGAPARPAAFAKKVNITQRYVDILTGKSPADVAGALKKRGWKQSTPQSAFPDKIQHTVFTRRTKAGDTYMLDHHPGGGIHKSEYWKVYKIVDGEMQVLGRIAPSGFQNFGQITDSPVYIAGRLVN